ncbi:Prophage antirepressor [Izhakiella capsodis]|uniref:Prophage antirepressor n=1 Tax=Izhakiella capsodis TaxID=1367852 RepID=A0A1I4ZD16_9GAMM|nr:BRO family protein [Izhakiella capsodis]SFN48146.1 Prophage antirepressor [Izhakiella capsodis]
MSSVAISSFNFQGIELVPVASLTDVWLTSADIASALRYKSAKSITNLFNQNAEEFTIGMTQVIESVTSGNYRKKVRVFSLRGAHLLAMFARTQVAKEFRRWVLDILDKEVEQNALAPLSYQVLCRVENGKQVKIQMFGLDKTVDDVASWKIWMEHKGAVFFCSTIKKKENLYGIRLIAT